MFVFTKETPLKGIKTQQFRMFGTPWHMGCAPLSWISLLSIVFQETDRQISRARHATPYRGHSRTIVVLWKVQRSERGLGKSFGNFFGIDLWNLLSLYATEIREGSLRERSVLITNYIVWKVNNCCSPIVPLFIALVYFSGSETHFAKFW